MSHKTKVFLQRLKDAYQKDNIYVSIRSINMWAVNFKCVFFFKCLIGKVLVSLNPHKEIAYLYADKEMTKYRNETAECLAPHIYLIGKQKCDISRKI